MHLIITFFVFFSFISVNTLQAMQKPYKNLEKISYLIKKNAFNREPIPIEIVHDNKAMNTLHLGLTQEWNQRYYGKESHNHLGVIAQNLEEGRVKKEFYNVRIHESFLPYDHSSFCTEVLGFLTEKGAVSIILEDTNNEITPQKIAKLTHSLRQKSFNPSILKIAFSKNSLQDKSNKFSECMEACLKNKINKFVFKSLFQTSPSSVFFEFEAPSKKEYIEILEQEG